MLLAGLEVSESLFEILNDNFRVVNAIVNWEGLLEKSKKNSFNNFSSIGSYVFDFKWFSDCQSGNSTNHFSEVEEIFFFPVSDSGSDILGNFKSMPENS